ncbi:MAG: hypothetical protein QNJ88_05880 [Acidimicrobiia bacterium]|nr:hypothetical protein [Acidimicrobiia bacterium]
MRIAIHQTGEVGLRAARIILAERDLDVLGLLDRDPRATDDRVERVDHLDGYDVLVVDDLEGVDELAERALEAGTALCVWNDFDPGDLDGAFIERMSTILVGANLATGLTPCLAAHEVARGGHLMDVSIAWTEPGAPLRRGVAVPFPDPVGARWAKSRDYGDTEVLVAPVVGEWAGAMARVTSATGTGVVTRIVGVADLAPHLEALALASGAITLARGAFPLGMAEPKDAAETYLSAALAAGLDVASYELHDQS